MKLYSVKVIYIFIVQQFVHYGRLFMCYLQLNYPGQVSLILNQTSTAKFLHVIKQSEKSKITAAETATTTQCSLYTLTVTFFTIG